MKRPVIKTSLPGPKAGKLIGIDQTYVSPSYTRTYPLVADRGQGLWIRDVDGNEFLDFTAGIAVCATGHCHPRVVESIKRQADRLLHMSGTDFYYGPQIALAQKLATLVSDDEVHKVYFGNSGAEAVEAAFKLARWHTRRELNLAFYGAFHGRTMGDVRGKGLMVGVELVKDRQTKQRASHWRSEIISKAFEKGLLLLGCGENTVRFCPALTVSSEEIDVCLSIFDETVREVAG